MPNGIDAPRESSGCIVLTGVDAIAALAQLGLDQPDDADRIRSFVRVAVRTAREKEVGYASNYSGIVAHNEVLHGLCSMLRDRGWKDLERKNHLLIAHPDSGVTFGVSSADQDTGIREGDPCTRYAKGSMTRRVVIANHLRFDQTTPTFPKPALLRRNTYLLLFYDDIDRKQIRLEISRPLFMGSTNRLAGWDRRNILPPIDLSGAPAIKQPEPVSFDVRVRRN